MSRTRPWMWVVVVCLFSAPMVCAQSQPASDVSSAPASVAAVPRLIKFSGAVRDARGEPVTGAAVRLTFAVYSEQQGGAALWVEAQTVQLDEQGHYTVLLGATRADGLPVELFPAGKARWLGVQLEGHDEDPRVLLVSVPYALKAEDAAMLGGRQASDFVLGEQLKEEVRTQVAAQTPGIATQAVEMLVSNPPQVPAITEGPSTFTCATTGDCVAVTQSGTGRALRTTATSTTEAVLVQQNGTGYGLRALSPGNVALLGQVTGSAGTTYGVKGQTTSTTGAGVFGYNLATTGLAYGILGQTASTSGTALFGRATSVTGGTIGLRGHADSTSGTGIMGQATATSGTTTGIVGRVFSAAGTALVVDNTQGGKLLSGQVNGAEKLSADGSGNLVAVGALSGTQLISSVASGTAPLSVTSNTVVPSLNADLLDGVHASAFQPAGTYAALGTNTYTGTQTISSGDLSVTAGNVVASGSISTATGLISGAGGSFSGATADQIVGVLQSGTGSGLTGTTLGVDATSAGLRGLATNSQYLPVESAGVGVYGYSAARLGAGVKGESSAFRGIGVKGEVTDASGWNIGVQGITPSTDSDAAGVEGKSTGAVGVTRGVRGISASSTASSSGVYGAAQGGEGVTGSSYSGTGVAGYGSPGVKGRHNSTGIGVHGISDHGTAIKAEVPSIGYYLSTALLATTATSQDGTTGVLGEATSASGATIGVHGRSAGSDGTGVLGEATSTAFGTFGVKGTTASSLGTALAGVATGGGIGAYGESDTNVAGDFNRTDGSASGIILQARSGSDTKFKVQGDGNVYADGTFTGGGADFAEAMAVRGGRDEYEPGDVLTIDPTSDRRLTLARDAYSTHVAGIYSTKPGMLGRPYPMHDPRLDQGIPLAVVGIVPCKVSAENGSIERGDLLVSASTPGHAMRGTDRDRMLGAIVGKALEPLTSGTGVIQVLVTLQ